MNENCPVIYRIRNLRRVYRETVAVALERLDIRRGEILCLLGPTGAGKSTLLRLLAGLEPIDGGELAYAAAEGAIGRMSVQDRRRIAMVFQHPVLLQRSVRENIEAVLRFRHGRDIPPDAVPEVLERLKLSALSERPASTLSGGQLQLVALARSLVTQPDVLLLDEPTSHLDPAHVALVEQTIREDWTSRGTTIIWATHNIFQARRVAQRVALMLDGSLIEVGESDGFFDEPCDERTKAFVEGRMIW